MRRLLFIGSFAIATLALTACQQSAAASKPADDNSTSVAKKIELRDDNDEIVSLEPAGRSMGQPSDQQGVPPGLSARSTPDAAPRPAVILPSIPKKPVIDGAVVEELGPCSGRGVAGSITVNGEKKPICGGDNAASNPYGSYGYNNGYNNGYSSSNRYGSSSSRYSSRSSNTYRPRYP